MPVEPSGPRSRPGAPHLRAAPSAGQTAEQLLALVARGDEDAFAALYDLLAPPTYGLVRRIVRDPRQSEDVVQEVMVTVWQTATRFDPARGSAVTWVLTVAHRRAVDRVRAEQAASDRQQRVAAREHETAAADPVGEEVARRLDQQQVRRCLDGLTALQREAVTLAYYNGYTYREVAELVASPEGTVKTRIRDGLVRLRDCLEVAR